MLPYPGGAPYVKRAQQGKRISNNIHGVKISLLRYLTDCYTFLSFDNYLFFHTMHILGFRCA